MSPPSSILSLRLLAGEMPLGYEPGLWLRRESDWAAVAEQAVDRGIASVTTTSNLQLMGILKRSQWRRFEIIPQVPNITGIIRETYEHGMVGAGLRRLMLVGPVGALTMAGPGFAHIGGVLRREFPAMLSVLLELELRAFRRLSPQRLVLAPQITDMAVAFENPRLIELFAALCGRSGLGAVLATNNPMQLADRLPKWGIQVAGVVAPMNRSGYLCGDLSWAPALAPFGLIAETLGGGRPADESDIEFVHAHGAKAVILEADAVY